MNIYQLIATELQKPVAYGRLASKQDPPYFILMGAGQGQFEADTTYYTKKDNWQIEYYFKIKNPDFESVFETLLLNNGYRYTKSEDIYIEDEDVFVIYYDI